MAQIWKDWRGVDILIGSPIVYAAGGGGRGGGASMVEGVITDLLPDPNPRSKHGKVRFTIMRRTDDHVWTTSRKVTTVPCEKVTVVLGLPPSERKRFDLAIDEMKAKEDAKKAAIKAAKQAEVNEKRRKAALAKAGKKIFATHTVVGDSCSWCGIAGEALYANRCDSDDIIRYDVDA